MLQLTAAFALNRLTALLPLVLLAMACSDGGESSVSDGASGGGTQGSTSAGEGTGGSGEGSGEGTGAGEGSATGGGSEFGPEPVRLGMAGNYVVLAKSAISNVPTSVVTGDLGLSPAAASYITGFDLTKAGTKWTSAQVIGDIFAADNDPPTPTELTTAVTDMQGAYTDAAGRPGPDFLNLGGGTIGGLTLTPGLYKWSSSVTIPANLTISGGADAVWIFQITGDLSMGTGKEMILSGGARAQNIVWQVAGEVDLGTLAHAEGIMLSKSAIKLGTGASIDGRLFAQTSVDLAGAIITEP